MRQRLREMTCMQLVIFISVIRIQEQTGHWIWQLKNIGDLCERESVSKVQDGGIKLDGNEENGFFLIHPSNHY